MQSRPKQARYPALELWERRHEHPRKFATWKYDNLWRAACAEAEARENLNNPEHEQHFQREAIALLLGDPVHKVRLNATWTRRYVARLAELARKAAA